MMKLESPAFSDESTIPAIFAKDGDDISPPLHWTGAPPETASFALIVDDPDAPSGVFTHWVIYNIPPVMTALDREVPEGYRYGEHALQGINDYGDIGYGGPQPPDGEHRYVFTLYALDTMLALDYGASKDDLLMAMEDHVIDQCVLTGLYATKDQETLEREIAEFRKLEDAYDLAAQKNILQPETAKYDQSDEIIK